MLFKEKQVMKKIKRLLKKGEEIHYDSSEGVYKIDSIFISYTSEEVKRAGWFTERKFENRWGVEICFQKGGFGDDGSACRRICEYLRTQYHSQIEKRKLRKENNIKKYLSTN